MADPLPERADLPVRETARILLVDDAERILLFRFIDPAAAPPAPWWGTPGGGLLPGEPPAHAAARELYEETGLSVPAAHFTHVVARNEGPADFGGTRLRYRNRYYLLRTPAFEPDESGREEGERSWITGHRWWTAPELAATAESVHPPGLARLLPDLLAGRIPDEPVDVGRP